MVNILSWIRFLVVWGIIVFTIYSGYNYFVHPTDKTIKTSDNIKTSKHILTQKEKIHIKNNFSKIDNNFSNRIIHNGNGITIERIK